jgi:K+-sensing histidine kinase KdpD
MRYDKINKKNKKVLDEYNSLKLEHENLLKEKLKIETVLKNTMHEIRCFSGELSHYTEELNKSICCINNEKVKELAETIFYTSGLLTARLGFTDIELNPSVISRQLPLRMGVYKKFEKASHVLRKKAAAKNLNISFQGNSYLEIYAIQSFELVPFVILDNAIKYSPKDQKIDVLFEGNNNELCVKICNIGPTVDKNELLKLFERGIRSNNAKQSKIYGEGLGLYLAKSLCEFTKVSITANSSADQKFMLERIPYSEFSINLKFKNESSF